MDGGDDAGHDEHGLVLAGPRPRQLHIAIAICGPRRSAGRGSGSK